MLDKEYLKEWFSDYFTNIEPNPRAIADIHELIFKRGGSYGDGDAFVINVKNRGLPDWTTKEILEERLKVNLDDLFDNNWEYVDQYSYGVINNRVNELSEELGVDISFYGRSGGYIGIPVEDVDLSPVVIIKNFTEMIDQYVEKFIESFNEEDSQDQKKCEEDEEYLDHFLLDFAEKNEDIFYNYVTIPVLYKFRDKVEQLISTEFSSEGWVEKLEPIVRDYLKQKTLDNVFMKFRELLEPIVEKYVGETGDLSEKDFKKLLDIVIKEYVNSKEVINS
jgi:hypothetical protein